MKKIEAILSKVPFARKTLVYFRYLIFRYVITRQYKKYFINPSVTLSLVNKNQNTISFFGYYNIPPSNENGEVLYLTVNKEKIRGSLGESAAIMMKKANGSVAKLSETKAWNWQQGCMLQWVPKSPDQILFNDYDEICNQYVSKVINNQGELIKTYPLSVNNVSKCGQYALSLNYDRLAKMRPDYGYFNRKGVSLPSDEEDGIWNLNFETSETRLIISLAQLKHLSYSDTMDGAMQKVNHIDINPDGSRFMFLHRWIGPRGRFMRLITANPDGADIQILNGDIMTSHCCWLNNNSILSFCDYKGEKGYFEFKDSSNKVNFFSKNMPDKDGHPSVSPNGKWIITDTYPNKARMSYLYLYNIEQDKTIQIGRFYQPLKYRKEFRVDLHPKWGKSEDLLFFESGHLGQRQFFKLYSEFK